MATFGFPEALVALGREGPRDAQRPAFAMAGAAQSRATVEQLSPDGKSYLELHAADADKGGCGELFLRLLSRSIALQRNFSTGSLTVLTRSDVQSGNQNKGLRGWEMIEWE